MIELVEGAAHGTGRRPHLASIQLDAGPHDVVFYHWLNGDTGMYLFSSLQNGQMDEWDASRMELMPAFDIANVMTEDSDNDGLDDFWENFYFGNLSRDGSGDQDGDGLTDKAESENRANPTKKDTDGDGLEDGPEVAEHQTAPNLFDTDGDAISDGAEINEHQTDPNKRDSDDDNIADNIEITLGSLPNDPNSIPDIVVLLRDQATGRSWNDASFWSDGEAPSAGKSYQVGGVPGLGGTMRSPAANHPEFPGDALALDDGSTLRLKHGGTARFPAIAARNTTIQQGQANQTIGMESDITVTDSLTVDIQGENRRLDLSGALAGTGALTLRGVLGGVLSLNTPVSAFEGDVAVQDITLINAAPGSIRGGNVRLSGELWSDSVINLAGKRLTLIGSEVKLQLDKDVYVSELFFQPDREDESEFNLDGLLGDPAGTPIGAEWFDDGQLGSLNELVVSTGPDDETPQGRIIFSADADGDGLPDVWEGENGLDTAIDDAQGDGDGDGLTNELEFYLATALDNTDSDGDGLTDGDEFNTHGSSPSSKDSDGDGLEDGAEVNEHNTSPALADTDGDGLTDDDEISVHGTNPTLADSDGDGADDRIELNANTDANDPESTVGVWRVRTVNSSIALNSLERAEAALAGTGASGEVQSQHLTINFAPDTAGNFEGDEIFPNMSEVGQDLNDFVIEATGKFAVNTDGTYTLGFNTDDGGALHVNGDEVVAFPGTRAPGDSLGTVALTAGEHDLRFVMFERGGGSAAELFISNEAGEFTEFSDAQFQLLTAVPSEAPAADGDLANGLQGYWTFDEGAGATASDSSGNDRNAETLSGSIIWADGKFGKAIDFDGATSVHTPNYFGVGGNTPRTISMWINTSWEVPDGATGLMGFGISANEQKWHFKIETSSKGLRTENQGGNNFGAVPVNDGQWHHVVSVFPEGGAVIGDVIHYVDGVVDETKNGGLTRPVDTETNPDNGARTLSIGSAFQGEVERFTQGLIDEVAIWDRALSPEEIAQLGANPITTILGIEPPTGEPVGPTEAPAAPAVVRTDTGAIAITVPAGETYDIEYSTDLVTWTPIASGISGTTFEDTDASRTSEPIGFYRGRRP